jgi:hypothetical protein
MHCPSRGNLNAVCAIREVQEMRNETDQNQAKTFNLPELRCETTGRAKAPTKLIHRKMNAAFKKAQRGPDMSIEEIPSF